MGQEREGGIQRARKSREGKRECGCRAVHELINLVRALREDDTHCEVRQQLGQACVLQKVRDNIRKIIFQNASSHISMCVWPSFLAQTALHSYQFTG